MKKRMIFFFLGLVCLFGRVEIVVGQEVAVHPDSSAEKVGGAPVVVYGEIVSYGPIQELSVKAYLDYYYDAFVGTGIVNEPLTLEKGIFIWAKFQPIHGILHGCPLPWYIRFMSASSNRAER